MVRWPAPGIITTSAFGVSAACSRIVSGRASSNSPQWKSTGILKVLSWTCDRNS